MEEFWKDISFSPSHHPISAAATAAVSVADVNNVSHTTILQEFLALPTDAGIPHRGTVSASSAQLDGPSPSTALPLNTHHRFPFPPPQGDSLPSHPPPPPLHSLTRKRGPEPDDNGGDRRHERLMKNRESAARSRARKQVIFFFFFTYISFLDHFNFHY